MIGIDKYKLREVVKADTATFSIFLPGGAADEKSSEKLFTSLNRIFQDAVQLQASFMTSRAIFLLKWPEVCRSTGIISFDPERMDAEIWEKEPLDKSSIVKLTVSPCLIKAGTADGEDYDQRLLLTRARVVCN
nr:uncharacterized protein CTRU02_07611 [Colletotrichum truncatum]KAF6791271.1 hypothetical protein CTRU02_07611 [Colletotrichum truncatum]